MATRNERVVLSLDDQGFSTGMAKAAASAALLERSLDDLDGTNVRTGKGLPATSREVDNLGGAFRRNTSDLNQFTGRLGLVRDLGLTVGPAFIPISAVAVPAVTGLAAAFGFAATGAGAAIVAFQGVGTALDAMRKAQLEPTAENLEAAREAMQQIGPPAREFVRELTAMRPALDAVRDAAADGLFTQLTPALDDMEAALPRVASLFEAVGAAVGELGADAIESLTGPKWAEFFAFIERETPDALSDLGSVVGSLAHGMAELWMAFQPLNNDFVGWLRDSADGFDQWAKGLSQTQGFNDFIDYIRENGPRVADAMGSIGNALIQVTQAAAPLGGPVLNIISRLADIVAALADSSLGTPLFTLAAGLAAINRATSLMGKSGGGLAALTTNIKQLGVAAAALVALEAGGRALEFFRDKAAGAAPDVSSLTDSLKAGSSVVDEFGGSLNGALGAIDMDGFDGLLQDFNALGESGGAAGKLVAAGLAAMTGQSGKTEALAIQTEKAAEAFGSLDAALVRVANEQGIPQARQAFGELVDSQKLSSNEVDNLIAQLPQYTAVVGDAGGKTGSLTGSLLAITPALGAYANVSGAAAAEARDAADAARDLNNALLGLSGWLDKREAMRGFEDAMRELNKSLDSGKINQWGAAIDNVGRNFIQVANSLKNQPVKQDNFIDGAVKDLRALARDAGPKAQAQVQELIGRLQRVAKIEARPKVDVDGKPARTEIDHVHGELKGLDKDSAEPKVNVDPGNSIGTLNNIRSLIAGINDKTVRITTIHQSVGRSTRGGLTSDTGTSADGGTVPKTGLPYADRHPYLLADGEEVISNRFGQADRHRSLLKAINAGRLADGGTAGDSTFTLPGRGDSVFTTGLGGEARDAARGLRALNKQLKAAEKAVERERKQRDAIVSRQDQIRSGISNSFLSDPFGNLGSNVWAPGGGGNLIGTLQADLNGVRTFNSLLKGLGGKGSKGIDGAALEFLAQSGNVAGLQALAAMSPAQREQWERLFERRAREVRGVGNRAADQVLGAALARESRQLENVQKELRAIKQAIREESKRDRDNRDRNTDRRNRNDGKGAGNARRKARR